MIGARRWLRPYLLAEGSIWLLMSSCAVLLVGWEKFW